MKNFKKNEQDLYDFNVWICTRSYYSTWIQAIMASEYIATMKALKEMNE